MPLIRVSGTETKDAPKPYQYVPTLRSVSTNTREINPCYHSITLLYQLRCEGIGPFDLKGRLMSAPAKVLKEFESILKAVPRVRQALTKVKDVVAVRPGYHYPPSGDPIPAVVVAVIPGTTPTNPVEQS